MNRNTSEYHHPPRRRRRGTARLLRWAAVPAFSLLFATQAFGGTTGKIEWMTFPHYTVASDGNHYTGVGPLASGWEARILIESGVLGRIKSWSVYPNLAVSGVGELSFALYDAHKSYPFANRPKTVHKTVGALFPNSFVEDFVAEACNHNLELLMDQGYTRQQVLAQDRTIAAQIWGSLSFDVTVDYTIVEAFVKDVEITCEKSPFVPLPPGPGGIQSGSEFNVDNASLVIFPDNYSGACPKDLTLFMEVQGTMKGTFEARIESTAGWKSTAFVLQTNEFDGGSGLWGREFSEAFPVPVELPPPSSGGGGVPAGPGNLQALPKPGDDLFPGQGGGAQAVGGLTGKDPGSNVHQQSLRLAAKANGKTVYSDWRQYRVVCDPKVAIQPATTAFMPGGSGPGPKPGDGDPKPRPTEPQPTNPPQPGNPQPKDPQGKQPAPKSPSKPGKVEPESQIISARDTSVGRSSKKGKSGLGKPAKAGKSKGSPPQQAKGFAKPKDQRADLRVLRARRSAKSPAVIEFEVENAGHSSSRKAVARLTCAKAAGGAETWRVALPEIPGGHKRWVESRPVGAKSSRARVRGCDILVDSTQVVVESNESNNSYSCGNCAPPAKRKTR